MNFETILNRIGADEYYRDADFVLYKGDCREIMSRIPSCCIDMIFADPPYRLSNGGITCKSGKRALVDKGVWDRSEGVEKDVEFSKCWIGESKRVLKDTGTIWISGTYHSINISGFLLQKLGYRILNEIIWYKPNAAPNISCRCFAASHETLLWARKGAKHKFNYKEMKTWHSDGINKLGKQMRDVWKIPTTSLSEKKLGAHPTQKPIELLKRIISSCTDEGDVVLDPFTGSSTTGIVCKRLGRKYIGIDISEEYLDLSVKRYEVEKRRNVVARTLEPFLD